MSRMLYFEVWNFMSIEHARCDFDEHNIIHLVGYNDSGKSSMLVALRCLLANAFATKQVTFIQDDKDYFRVVCVFDDGIRILRDKYINGQSLYEMYKGDQLIFTTRSGNTLTKVSEVPEPIAKYLDLIIYDGACLNARSCFEPQLGVQSSGSENYGMFNTVLGSEEIASAGSLLNSDRNKLATDIATADAELQVQRGLYNQVRGITESMLEALGAADSDIDILESKGSQLSGMYSRRNDFNAIQVLPELRGIDTARLDDLTSLENTRGTLSGIHVTPNLDIIDVDRINSLNRMQVLLSSISILPVAPELSQIQGSERISQLSVLSTLRWAVTEIQVLPSLEAVASGRIAELSVIAGLFNALKECDSDLSDIASKTSSLGVELHELSSKLSKLGVRQVRCPHCGTHFAIEES